MTEESFNDINKGWRINLLFKAFQYTLQVTIGGGGMYDQYTNSVNNLMKLTGAVNPEQLSDYQIK